MTAPTCQGCAELRATLEELPTRAECARLLELSRDRTIHLEQMRRKLEALNKLHTQERRNTRTLREWLKKIVDEAQSMAECAGDNDETSAASDLAELGDMAQNALNGRECD